MASEYGWDHVHIRERFTRAQLDLYIERLNDRIQARNDAQSGRTGFQDCRVDFAQAGRSGEIERVYGGVN